MIQSLLSSIRENVALQQLSRGGASCHGADDPGSDLRGYSDENHRVVLGGTHVVAEAHYPELFHRLAGTPYHPRGSGIRHTGVMVRDSTCADLWSTDVGSVGSDAGALAEGQDLGVQLLQHAGVNTSLRQPPARHPDGGALPPRQSEALLQAHGLDVVGVGD